MQKIKHVSLFQKEQGLCTKDCTKSVKFISQL